HRSRIGEPAASAAGFVFTRRLTPPVRRGYVMDFHLPQLGEGVYEAEMVRWLVAAGDAVRHGQGLMEVMTDKATMEVPAPFAGTVTELRVQPGQTIKVGDLILSYTPGAAVPEEIGPPAQPAVPLPLEAEPIRPEYNGLAEEM